MITQRRRSTAIIWPIIEPWWPLAGPRDVGTGAHDAEQGAAGRDVDRRQHPEDRAPAQPVAERAAQRGARHQAERLARQEAGQRRLAALVADIVAKPGDGERNDGRAGDAGQEARQPPARRASPPSRSAGSTTRREAGDGDHRHLAVAVAERAVHQHEHAVGEQEGGGGDRGRADADAEGGGKLHQQGSMTRMLAAEAKAATESRTMAKVGARVGGGRAAEAGELMATRLAARPRKGKDSWRAAALPYGADHAGRNLAALRRPQRLARRS